MRMRMKLELLLLVAAAFPSSLSQRGHESGHDSRLDSQDSRQDSCQDSRGSPQDSHLDFWDSLQDSPQDSQGSPQDSPQDSRGSPQGSPKDSRGSRGSPPGPRRPALPPRHLPAPLILRLLPDPPGTPRIRCLAPRRFSGSTFELLPGIAAGMAAGIPVRSVPAAPDQHWVEFPLPGAARCWRCRYRSHNGSAWLESELSSGFGDAECQRSDAIATGAAPTAGTLRDGNGTGTGNDPSWLLPVSLGAAVLGLLLLLGAAAAGWRGLRRRGQNHAVPAPSLPMAPAPSLSR